MKCSKFKLLLLLAMTLAGSAQAQNIVQNGSFASGSLLDWTRSQSSNYPWTVRNDFRGVQPPVGNYSAVTGCEGAQCLQYGGNHANDLFQVLGTTNGTKYSLSFYLADFGGAPSALDVYWGGHEVLALSPLSTASGYFEYTVSGLTATSSTTKLEFLGEQKPGYLALTDISVTAVPEPPAYAFMFAGLCGIGLITQRRRIR